jgi:adenine C2-methylase RlmN of 23S rRNA A2503 and tRNA A37
MGLKEKIEQLEPKTMSKDALFFFGDQKEGAVELPGITLEEQIVEIGYYFGASKPKSVIGISSQIGCASRCRFCELGDEPFVRSLTADEMYDEVVLMLKAAYACGILDKNDKHKVSIARSGEPLLNENLLGGLEKISDFGFSFKVSTVMPLAALALRTLYDVARFGSRYSEPVQLQISLVSTNDEYRRHITGREVYSIDQIGKLAIRWKELYPQSRKINLSLILTEEVPVDVNEVCKTLSPELFRFRFRDYIPTQNGKQTSLETVSEERYHLIKKFFEDEGYEVGDWARPLKYEWKFGLAANSTRRRYIQMVNREI